MTRRLVRSTAILAAAWLSLSGNSARAAERPNIIIIMSDDMGFSDLGCYGGEIDTPNLDRLAEGGVRFTQFYNTGRCCPTRASLLTGLYPHQAGVGHMMNDRGFDGYRGDLNRNCMTIAEVLRSTGYATLMAGKWHVTKSIVAEGPKDNWPLQRGFDRFYGTISGAGSFYDPFSLVRDNTMISALGDDQYQVKQYYYTDAISDNAARFLADHKRDAPGKPFFMYVAYTAAHWPMHALEKDVAKYKGKYDEGYAAIRQARFERVKKLGLVRPDWQVTPQARRWDDVEHKAWEARCMEVYAAMIDNMDQGIGRIMAQLEKNAQLDNTLVFFLQDNGGCAEGLGRTPRGKFVSRPERPPFPPMARDELQLAMIPPQTRDGFPTVMGPGAMPGPDGTYIAYGEGWANVSNTPFREYKHWVHEGGIATPLIVHWPTGMPRTNRLEHQPGHLVNLMATCVDAAGAKYPEQYRDQRIKPMEGRSLVPALEGREIEREALFWEHEGNRAVRVGHWKLVAKGARGQWELYDMRADRTEMHDLASAQPQRAEQMAALWQAYAERANVLPLNPNSGRSAKKKFSKKKSFELSQGDDLERAAAPFVEGKTFSITASVQPKGDAGVIVAQGGVTDGYALYLREGKLTFATRHEGTLTLVAAESPLPSKAAMIDVTLAKDGTVTLTIDGRQVARGKVPGPMARMPLDGLQVGSDLNGAVGRYEAPHPFAGRIENLTIKVSD